MSINSENIKTFWDSRAIQYKNDGSRNVTNLEEDEELQKLKIKLEQKHVFNLLQLDSSYRILDLGAGIGAWSFLFAKKCKEVIAVDYSEKMIGVAKNISAEQNIYNIKFICSEVQNFSSDIPFDVIFISGLLLYLSDKEIGDLLQKIKTYSKPGTFLFLREPYGVNGRYEINNKYLDAYKSSYSALYRTRNELIEIFEQIGYSHVIDEDMFEQGCVLNKWKETRLGLYLFKYKTSGF